ISQQYGVPVNALIQVNQLTNPNALQIGEMLIIPPRTHLIQSGETLSQIANQYGVSVQAIINENQIQDPNMIYPGVQLIIPRNKQTIEVNAYTYQPSAESVNSSNKFSNLHTYLIPFAYMVSEDGNLSTIQDEAMISAAKSKNAVPMMSITNFSSTAAGSNVAHTVLANPV